MEQCTIPSTELNNLGIKYKGNLSHPEDFTFNRYTLFSILCQNSFPGSLCQNTILGTLQALVNELVS